MPKKPRQNQNNDAMGTAIPLSPKLISVAPVIKPLIGSGQFDEEAADARVRKFQKETTPSYETLSKLQRHRPYLWRDTTFVLEFSTGRSLEQIGEGQGLSASRVRSIIIRLAGELDLLSYRVPRDRRRKRYVKNDTSVLRDPDWVPTVERVCKHVFAELGHPGRGMRGQSGKLSNHSRLHAQQVRLQNEVETLRRLCEKALELLPQKRHSQFRKEVERAIKRR